MITFLILIAIAEPSAALFVEPNGRFFLNVTFQEEWSKAEVHFDQSLGFFTQDNMRHFSYEGSFERVPDVLNMKMELTKDNIGQEIDLPIPVVYLPFSHPSLGGEKELPLPNYSFHWHVYSKIISPLNSLFAP